MPKRFSASSAAQLMSCPGSANLELAIPGWVPPVVDEMAGAKGVGTNIHAVLEPLVPLTSRLLAEYADLVRELANLHWTKRRPLLSDPNELQRWMLKEMPGFVPDLYIVCLWAQGLHDFPPKMLRFIVDALDYLIRLKYKRSRTGETKMWSAERTYECTWLTSRPKTTVDVVGYGTRTLDILDWKSGKIPVSPVENDQLMFYAVSALAEWSNVTSVQRVVMHIVQPGNIDNWECSIAELMAWKRRAQHTDSLIQQKDLTLRPSDHCTFCPANPHSRGDKAKPYCPAMMEMLYPSVADEDEIFAM